MQAHKQTQGQVGGRMAPAIADRRGVVEVVKETSESVYDKRAEVFLE